MKTRILEIQKGVLDKNDQLAQSLRTRFYDAGVWVVNLASGPGAGKTALLEQTLRLMKDHGHVAAALVGDLETLERVLDARPDAVLADGLLDPVEGMDGLQAAGLIRGVPRFFRQPVHHLGGLGI